MLLNRIIILHTLTPLQSHISTAVVVVVFALGPSRNTPITPTHSPPPRNTFHEAENFINAITEASGTGCKRFLNTNRITERDKGSAAGATAVLLTVYASGEVDD